MLTRDEILKNTTLPTRVVNIPEWGGDVTVRGFTAGERDRFEELISKKDGREGIRAEIVIMCVVDGDGKRLFTNMDHAALNGMHAKPLDIVLDAILELSGIRNMEKNERSSPPNESFGSD